MNNHNIKISEIEDGLEMLFPKAIKSLDIEEEEDPDTFLFKLEFVGGVEDLIIPDGVFIGYIDFKEKYVDGFIDGISFLEFVKENK